MGSVITRSTQNNGALYTDTKHATKMPTHKDGLVVPVIDPCVSGPAVVHRKCDGRDDAEVDEGFHECPANNCWSRIQKMLAK